MKAKERLDKIFLACQGRIQEEVGSLIGKPFQLGKPECQLLAREDVFGERLEKRVFAHVKIEGDIQGHGSLLMNIKDAIRIGGVLIMLPETELEAVITEAEYTDELKDSFGEIANIICGAVTFVFEEQYPKTVRLIRTEQEVIAPAKLDLSDGKLLDEESYYVATLSMQLDGKEMGLLDLLLPAQQFGLVEKKQPVESQPEGPASSEAQSKGEADGELDSGSEPDSGSKPTLSDAASTETASDESAKTKETSATTDTGESDAPSPSPKKTSPQNLEKQKKLVDGLLKLSMKQMGEEVSALTGGTFSVSHESFLLCSKEEFLEQAGGKQILTRMDVRGGKTGEAYLLVTVRTAVYLGGALIMLPESELEQTAKEEQFGEEAQDAYGEITNIIAGVYTAIFEEQYRGKLGFVKTSIEPIVPIKIDCDSDEVIPNDVYVVSVATMRYNKQDLGRLQLAVPASLFELEALYKPLTEEAEDDSIAQNEKAQPQAEQGASGEEVKESSEKKSTQATEEAGLRSKDVQADSADILIYTDDDDEAEHIAEILRTMEHTPRILHFKDPVSGLLGASVQLVFLVMREVSEQGFGVAIKINSSGSTIPLVASGPAWTRTLVLKAVKYGACDILVTPSSEDDVREKLTNNLTKIAA